jgi:hypothetical protein
MKAKVAAQHALHARQSEMNATSKNAVSHP